MNFRFLFVKIFLFFSLFFCGCNAEQNTEQRSNTKEPQRIVSTVPSITETLFELGLGDRIVGVCRFCKYPPETADIPKIGGLLDRDDEMILRLAPELIIELEENVKARQHYEDFGMTVLTVNHKTVDGVLDSFLKIGAFFDESRLKKAEEIRQKIVERLDAVEKRTKSLQPIRTLICVDRERGTGSLLSIFIAGNNPYYQRTLEIAGGINVAQKASSAFPVVGTEEILRMNPEVILDLRTGDSPTISPDNDLADWLTLGESVDAVKNRRIYTLTDDYATIPGPRMILYVEKIAELLHPQ